ncbi:MAG: hypothetical protein ACOX8W_06960 [bacterium]|jgi:hypothetical protein
MMRAAKQAVFFLCRPVHLPDGGELLPGSGMLAAVPTGIGIDGSPVLQFGDDTGNISVSSGPPKRSATLTLPSAASEFHFASCG